MVNSKLSRPQWHRKICDQTKSQTVGAVNRHLHVVKPNSDQLSDQPATVQTFVLALRRIQDDETSYIPNNNKNID